MNKGDKITLIEPFEPTFGGPSYTLNHIYEIVDLVENHVYVENDDVEAFKREILENNQSIGAHKTKIRGMCSIWGKHQIKSFFRNVREERLKKLKQINDNTNQTR